MLIFKLPYPPSVNTYWRNFRGRMVISKRGREFKKYVSEYVIENNIEKLGDAKLWVSMVLYPRGKRLMDIDNCIKPVLDALQDAGVFDDDQQVEMLSIKRGEVIKGGGISIIVSVTPLA